MASCSLNAKCWNVVGLLVGCGLCCVEEFQNLVPELGCLGSGFQISIIIKSFKFSIFFLIRWFPPEKNENFPGEIIFKSCSRQSGVRNEI